MGLFQGKGQFTCLVNKSFLLSFDMFKLPPSLFFSDLEPPSFFFLWVTVLLKEL